MVNASYCVGSGGGSIADAADQYNGGNGWTMKFNANGQANSAWAGTGGGGGRSSITGTWGGNGGNGGPRGGGGGGGGAASIAYKAGAGGQGGNGYVRITLW